METEFSKNLKAARQRKGFTLEQLANAYNNKFGGSMCKETLSQYENGKYTPKLTTVISLANILDVSVGWLVNSEPDIIHSETLTRDDVLTIMTEMTANKLARIIGQYAVKHRLSLNDIEAAHEIVVNRFRDCAVLKA